jgi:DNA-binding NarL/FixJ family response regulator
MAALLRVVLPTIRKNLTETYARALLRALAQQQAEQGTARTSRPRISHPLIDSLSPQEQRVFHLLVAGFSNPEIGYCQN